MLIMGMRYMSDVRNPYMVRLKYLRTQTIYDANVPISKKKEWLFGHGLLKKDEIDELWLDGVAVYSVCPEEQATDICTSIASLSNLDKHRKSVITDACACVGGNTLAFVLCDLFSSVNAVEINENRKMMLEHNVSVIKNRSKTQVTVFGEDYLNLMCKLKQDIVYIDPPWGGAGYKEHPNLQISLGGEHLAEIISVLHQNGLKTGTKYVVLKMPLNLDVQDMKSRLRKSNLSMSVLKHFKKYNLWYVDLTSSP
jgi:16S rRNA G966 N2-methylase RsmD